MGRRLAFREDRPDVLAVQGLFLLQRGAGKLHRAEGPNLLVLKHNVKYMYKVEDVEDGDGASDGDGAGNGASEAASEE